MQCEWWGSLRDHLVGEVDSLHQACSVPQLSNPGLRGLWMSQLPSPGQQGHIGLPHGAHSEHFPAWSLGKKGLTKPVLMSLE